MSQALKHYLQFSDLTADEYAYLFTRSALIKSKFKAYDKHQPLIDRTLAMIFEKASTRTRISFEAGMYQMGGAVVHLTTGDSQLGRAEPIEDSAIINWRERRELAEDMAMGQAAAREREEDVHTDRVDIEETAPRPVRIVVDP